MPSLPTLCHPGMKEIEQDADVPGGAHGADHRPSSTSQLYNGVWSCQGLIAMHY